ncbi:MAG: hypothetical protein WCW35_05530 [Bacteroidota bacterium]
MTKQLVHIVLFLTAWMSGCSLPEDTSVTTELYPPVINNAAASLKSLNIALLPPGSTTIDTMIIVTVSASDANGYFDITSVACSVISPGGELVETAQLFDDGISPDSAAKDSKYTGAVAIQIPKDVIGTYQIQLQTVDKSGYASTLVSLPLKIFNTVNDNPAVSNLTAPDTIFVPSAGVTELVKVSAAVNDANGMSDIMSVTLTIFRPIEGTVASIWQMYDDGGTVAVEPFKISSGDLVANDGIYTFTIPVPSDTRKDIERDFIITAVDQSDSSSAPVSKRVYFR